MPRRDRAAELRAFLDGSTTDAERVLRGLPDDIDADLAAAAVAQLVARAPYRVTNACKALPAAVIRRAVAGELAGPAGMFLRLATVTDGADGDAIASWKRAAEAIFDLVLHHAWESSARRTTLGKIAREPQLLAAVQGAVANCPEVPLAMLGVLVLDGGDASIDALIPHLDPALVHEDARLDRIVRLRPYAAATARMRTLFGEVTKTVDARNARSPAFDFCELAGIPQPAALWFQATIDSLERTRRDVPRITASIAADTTQARWLDVSVVRLETAAGTPEYCVSAFDGDGPRADALGLGHCTPRELPRWLAEISTKLGVRWTAPRVRSSLRGAKRDAIATWLAKIYFSSASGHVPE